MDKLRIVKYVDGLGEFYYRIQRRRFYIWCYVDRHGNIYDPFETKSLKYAVEMAEDILRRRASAKRIQVSSTIYTSEITDD